MTVCIFILGVYGAGKSVHDLVGHSFQLVAVVIQLLRFLFDLCLQILLEYAELKDAKRNLPKALIIGGIIIIVTYIAYYIGVAGGVSVDTLRAEGATVAF